MKDWFEFQKRLYRRTQRELKEGLAKKTKSLARYEAKFKSDNRNLKPSQMARLHKAISQAQVVFWGDFHSLKQSQRTLIRYLRNPKIKKPKILALEVLPKELESKVRNYCKKPSARKARELMGLMKLEETFTSSSKVYLELFEEAQRQGIQIKALRSEKKSLQARDKEMAQRLSALSEKTWVLVGEFHVARPHLPKILSQLRPDIKILCLQQNDDQLGLGQLKALSSGRNLVFEAPERFGIPLFSLLHTPLWVKWQSYLDHQLRKEEESELHIDAQEQITWCLKTLHQFVKDVRYPLAALDQLIDFEVLSLEDDFFEKPLSLRKSAYKNRLQSQMEAASVTYIMEKKTVLLSEVSLNACAQAAAQMLLVETKKKHIPHQWDFYQSSYFEALCFFMSKILNHSRKARSWSEFKAKKSKDWDSGEREALLRSRDFFQCFQSRQKFEDSMGAFRDHAAVQLGRSLAEKAFEAFLAGELSKQRVIRLICEDFPSPQEAFEVLMEFKASGRAFL